MMIDTLLVDEPGAFRSALRHLVLPSAVLGTYALAMVARMTRSALLETLGSDFVRAARARALPAWRAERSARATGAHRSPHTGQGNGQSIFRN
jgi:dipeptide transport system permease protein